uniref:Uncharacterized protein n=1 Tax=Alexandrium monilatum TaxID=311494 RepID=A0A7S4PRR7_9DINO|mmetsp:Transcript_101662/g.322976  ORF Transcript_101662/g.322976 Transcript_101662/m.322976 type:complete len:495 (+) Transcript_101662:16-1500(+)
MLRPRAAARRRRRPLAVGPAGAARTLAACWLALLFRVRGQATYPSEFRLAWCVGAQCFDHTLSAAHFQLRITRYYKEGARPPLREAFFVATLPPVFQKELLYGCPGLVVLAHLLLAEARLYTHPPEEAEELIRRAQAMMAMEEIRGPHLQGIRDAWPLAPAVSRYEALAERLAAHREPISIDFVLPRCREDLAWLADRSQLELLPPQTRVFVYEKCGEGGEDAGNLTALFGGHVKVIHSTLEDASDPDTGRAVRRDECTAYLAHVVRHYNAHMGDVVFFLHGTPSDHTPMGLLNLVLRGLALGTLRDLDFLHLGAPRMVATANPCQQDIFRIATGRSLQGPLFTYCCSQFAVSKRRIRQRPRSDYARMLRLVDGSVPDACDRIGPSFERYPGQRLSHCFFFEFMWHVVFGESEDLPLRADDPKLPLAFRLKDNEESVPSIWRSYLGTFVSGHSSFAEQGFEHWIRQIQTAEPLEARNQVNFGDLVHPSSSGAVQ